MESSGNVHFIGPEWYYSKDKSTQKLTHQSRQLLLRSATIAALMLIQQKDTGAPLNSQTELAPERTSAEAEALTEPLLAWTALGLQDTLTQTTAEYRSASLSAWEALGLQDTLTPTTTNYRGASLIAWGALGLQDALTQATIDYEAWKLMSALAEPNSNMSSEASRQQITTYFDYLFQTAKARADLEYPAKKTPSLSVDAPSIDGVVTSGYEAWAGKLDSSSNFVFTPPASTPANFNLEANTAAAALDMSVPNDTRNKAAVDELLAEAAAAAQKLSLARNNVVEYKSVDVVEATLSVAPIEQSHALTEAAVSLLTYAFIYQYSSTIMTPAEMQVMLLCVFDIYIYSIFSFLFMHSVCFLANICLKYMYLLEICIYLLSISYMYLILKKKTGISDIICGLFDMSPSLLSLVLSCRHTGTRLADCS